ncbi:hypothetical protein OL305_000527 [Vibrio parahaemolyticus]|nr:hypothetical protein [Vibrio parahaemolyticus]
MMKNIASMIFKFLGVFVLLAAIVDGGTVWSYILGFGLILFPFNAFSIYVAYILMIVTFLGSVLLGGYIGVQIGGKDSGVALLGLILGGFVGFKLVCSNYFDLLLEPIRKMSELDKYPPQIVQE